MTTSPTPPTSADTPNHNLLTALKQHPLSRFIAPVLKGAVSVMLIVYVGSLISLLDASHVLDTIDWPMLLAAFVCQTGVVASGIVRLWLLTRHAMATSGNDDLIGDATENYPPLGIGRVGRITLASLTIGLVTPGLVGVEGYKLYQLSRHMAWARAVSLLFVERFTALAVIMGSFVVGSLWLGQTLSLQGSPVMLGGLAAGSALMLVLVIGYRGEWLPAWLTAVMGKGLDVLYKGLACLQAFTVQELSVLAVMSMVVEVCRIASLGLFIMALGAWLPWPVLMVAAALSTVMCFLPISLNGIGVREVSLTVVFTAYGVGMAQAGLVSVLSRLTMLVWAVPGLVFFFTMRKSLIAQTGPPSSTASTAAPVLQ